MNILAKPKMYAPTQTSVLNNAYKSNDFFDRSNLISSFFLDNKVLNFSNLLNLKK